MVQKKSLGQNFLTDKGILKKIADFAQIEKTDTVVEVGPGQGSLTELLLESAEKVIAIEKDEKLAELLKEKFAEEIKKGKLEIVCRDILDANIFPSQAQKYILVGNIPYYITGALFKKALESENPPKSITFVVQKEVAERIIAKDGKESILSISIKAYGKPYFGGIIKAGSFNPKPKVDSAIISIRNITPLAPRSVRVFPRLTLRGEEKIQNFDKKFFEILKKGFSHKRKLLIKNLETTEEIFEKCGIPEKARAENLKVEDWMSLTKSLL
ncbi:MAG: 16S rRNA (adenine(1518)-N(6)/adenine(1519)-N(6))-dimethyltransferase RsmA [Patescibacteria group bacterium]